MFCCCTREKKIKYEQLRTIQIDIKKEEKIQLPPLPDSEDDTVDE
jgi:hypothetical protein